MLKKELWLRLHHYHFDHLVPAHLTDQVLAAFGGSDSSTHAFASKIAGKLGWSRVFALRAIAEYKKFVFLGVVSDASVTPPKVIDQVWHEHLLFSRAYRDFCREVLVRDFDHNPELVPTGEQTQKYQSQFESTLARYRREFNHEPPADIWGTPKFKERRAADADASTYLSTGGDDSAPLHSEFGGSGEDGGFGGGGGFAGGGSGRSWGDADPSDAHAGHHGADDAGSGGDGSGDSGGGSDGGGSGCSSSCGGGGE